MGSEGSGLGSGSGAGSAPSSSLSCLALWIAAAASTIPLPQPSRSQSLTGAAVSCSRVVALSPVSEGSMARSSATVPATCGLAWLVPTMRA